MRIIQAEYLCTAVKPQQYPQEKLPEITFLGRSNVGKSSLINSLCNHRGLARVSNTPGKTQTVNFYRLRGRFTPDVDRDFYLVDLPGYGYAKVSRTQQRQWEEFITLYLRSASYLQMVCLLLDIRHPPQASDLAAFREMHDTVGKELVLVGTKADKLSRSRQAAQRQVLAAAFNISMQNVFLYSSLNGQGRDELLERIAGVIGDLPAAAADPD